MKRIIVYCWSNAEKRMVLDGVLAFWRKHKPNKAIAKLDDTTLSDNCETVEVIGVDELAVKLQGARYVQVVSGMEMLESMELFDGLMELMGTAVKEETK